MSDLFQFYVAISLTCAFVAWVYISTLHDEIKMLKNDRAWWERQSNKHRNTLQSYLSKIDVLKRNGIISIRVAKKYEI